MYKTWKLWRKLGSHTLISQNVKRISTTGNLFKRNNSIDVDDLFSDQDSTAIQTIPKRIGLGDSICKLIFLNSYINNRLSECL